MSANKKAIAAAIKAMNEGFKGGGADPKQIAFIKAFEHDTAEFFIGYYLAAMDKAGWQMVPKKATEKMVDHGSAQNVEAHRSGRMWADPRCVWNAMMSVAPSSGDA